jgi:hypothetical protein
MCTVIRRKFSILLCFQRNWSEKVLPCTHNWHYTYNFLLEAKQICWWHNFYHTVWTDWMSLRWTRKPQIDIFIFTVTSLGGVRTALIGHKLNAPIYWEVEKDKESPPCLERDFVQAERLKLGQQIRHSWPCWPLERLTCPDMYDWYWYNVIIIFTSCPYNIYFLYFLSFSI